MTSFRASFAFAAILASAGAACAGAADREAAAAPAWFEARSQELDAEGYPELARAPAAPTATVDAAHWAQVQAELAAAEAALRAHPRSAAETDAPEPESFEAGAREALEAARDPR